MIYLAEFQLFNDVDGRHHRVLNPHSECDTFRRIVKVLNPNTYTHMGIIERIIQDEYAHLRIANLAISKMLTDEYE